MMDAAHFKTVRERHASYEAARRNVIKLAGDALNASKRAIFALHRDDLAGADQLLAEAAAGFEAVAKLTEALPDLASEGSYRAAMEEFVESTLYRQFRHGEPIGAVPGRHIDHEIYLGGLTDLTGEIQRLMVRFATEGRFDELRQAKDAIEEIINHLLAMDLGGYLRTKFDQAKNNLRRAEDILYETSIRRK